MNAPRYKRQRALCKRCMKIVCVIVPPGGDGSAWVYDRHPRGGPYCEASRQVVPHNDLVEDDG